MATAYGSSAESTSREHAAAQDGGEDEEQRDGGGHERAADGRRCPGPPGCRRRPGCVVRPGSVVRLSCVVRLGPGRGGGRVGWGGVRGLGHEAHAKQAWGGSPVL
ncbi:hypothetical protein HEK616_01210 [Streptomyces nigrescens]|uniref:Uncharacterized protein n=1 Tax=Streptomyces nigrescens TaxID=1920 RepID=A0ABM7ZKU8_STRNI|nr:hypothetical protein HEK616_01210 [Streptomyces nigrescens]